MFDETLPFNICHSIGVGKIFFYIHSVVRTNGDCLQRRMRTVLCLEMGLGKALVGVKILKIWH